MNEKGLNQVCNSGYASTTTKDRVCLSIAVWSRQAQVCTELGTQGRTELGKQFVPSGMASLYLHLFSLHVEKTGVHIAIPTVLTFLMSLTLGVWCSQCTRVAQVSWW